MTTPTTACYAYRFQLVGVLPDVAFPPPRPLASTPRPAPSRDRRPHKALRRGEAAADAPPPPTRTAAAAPATAASQSRPPDLFALQAFDVARGDFMAYHTDGLQVHENQQNAALPGTDVRPNAPTSRHRCVVPTRCACRSQTISLNLFFDFNFWFRPYPDGNPQRCIALVDGMTLLWKGAADQRHKHGVWRPTGASTGVRMSAVWRWSQRSESFSTCYPHRIIMSAEEQERVHEMRAQTAARRMRWTHPAGSEHDMQTRACHA